MEIIKYDSQGRPKVAGSGGGAAQLDELDDVDSAAQDPRKVIATPSGGGNYAGRSLEAADISDFDTEVGNHADVGANTSARHSQGTDAGLDTGGANEVTAAAITGHIGDADKHREINDAGVADTDLWSADKITSELGSLNFEDGADVTDAANVDAAGAVMESDFGVQTVLVAVLDDTPAAQVVGEGEFVGRKTGGDVGVMTAAEARGELNVEDGAAADQDAGDVPYTPGTLADWDEDADPGNVDDALDQLAERTDDLEGIAIPSDAGDLTYTPAVDTDWDGDADPGNVDDALDQLAERIDDVEAISIPSDLSDLTYTPAVAADWDGDADPGDADDALDQLAERVDDLEAGGGGGGLASLEDVTAFYDSGWFAVTKNTLYSKAHGLGTRPILVIIFHSASGPGSDEWVRVTSLGDAADRRDGCGVDGTYVRDSCADSGSRGTCASWRRESASGYHRIFAWA